LARSRAGARVKVRNVQKHFMESVFIKHFHNPYLRRKEKLGFNGSALQMHTSIIGSEAFGQAAGTGLPKRDIIFFDIDTFRRIGKIDLYSY